MIVVHFTYFVFILTITAGRHVSLHHGNVSVVKEIAAELSKINDADKLACKGLCQDGCSSMTDNRFSILVGLIQNGDKKQNRHKKKEATCFTCGRGFDKYFRPSEAIHQPGSCYKMLREAGGWRSADRKCRRLGSHLAALETTEEIKHFREIFTKANRKGLNAFRGYWLGGKKVNRVWYWVMSGEKIKNTDWVGDTSFLDFKVLKRDFLYVDPRSLKWYPASEWATSLGICEKKATC